MITPNTKVSAVEILEECGIANAEAIFGTMRVRIGGIMGVNGPDHLINIPAETNEIEVIVGNDVYDLELSKGNKDDNKDIRTISTRAKAVLEVEGRQETKKSEELQAVKALARKIQENDGTYTPTKEEEKHLERAEEIVVAEVALEEAQEAEKLNQTRIKKVSK